MRPPIHHRPSCPTGWLHNNLECLIPPHKNTKNTNTKPARPSPILDDNISEFGPGFAGGLETAFKQLEFIGKGGFGTVYKAINITTGEVVAMKKLRVINDSLPADIQHLSHCQRHPHPNIVELKDFGCCWKEEDVAYVAMEFFPYDLRSFASQVQTMSERATCSIMHQLLKGIAHLHSIGIVHCDIKPDNTLIDSKGRVKLCDFGLATTINSPKATLPHRNTRCTDVKPRFGTLKYCAPEILLDDSDGYSAAIDIWAAGCVLAELILQKPLFQGQDVDDQIDQILGLVGLDSDRQRRLCLLKSRKSERYNTSRCRNLHKEQTMPFERLREKIPVSKLSVEGFSLLASMLHPTPQKRITAEEALKHSSIVVEFEPHVVADLVVPKGDVVIIDVIPLMDADLLGAGPGLRRHQLLSR